MAGPEYGRNTTTLAGPAYDQFGGGVDTHKQHPSQSTQSSKGKRRESSMFGMGNVLGQRKPSNQQMKDGREFFSKQT